MSQGTVRIIGGKWRSRRLAFPHNLNIRPTPDRVRETLFNWLQPMIQGMLCLDLFAGSGALGFEALSRGASWVSFLDQSPKIVYYLRQQIVKFAILDRATVSIARFPFSKSLTPRKAFTLVFLDPPFRQDLLEPSLHWLETQSILDTQAWIYIEHEVELKFPKLPPHWQVVRVQRAGQITYALLERCLLSGCSI